MMQMFDEEIVMAKFDIIMDYIFIIILCQTLTDSHITLK